jgi:4a-hydroxytetrahydrobiopterin dehydratase
MKLSIEEIKNLHSTLKDGWVIEENTLIKEFEFQSFLNAFSFMTIIAMHAHLMNHHPRFINSYNTVRIELITHDFNGLTFLDFEFAKFIDQI